MWKTEEIVTLSIFYLFFIAFFIAMVIFIIQYRLKKKQNNKMLQIQHDEHKQELLSTQIEIQRQTMQHIGREIHDNIGQKLTLASLYTQQLAYENKAPHINENIENISNIINQSLSELRELSKTLTNNAIDSNSIAQLLKQEISKVNELKVVNIDFNSNASHVHLPYQSKSVLLRITQEFIQNSIKHSNCEKITVLLTKQDTTLLLSLQDNGKGFDTSKTKSGGIGLNNMKKRAEIIGGNYNLTSSVNGTKLTIEIELI